MSKTNLIVAVMLSAGLAGCATKPAPAPENLNNDPLVVKLTAAADLAQRDLARLSRAENSIADQKRTPLDRQRTATAQGVTVPGFERTTKEDIILPYPKAIERVASLAGYRFMASAAIPSNPIVVNVTGRGQTLKEVMSQVMDQAPSDMMIHVYAATKTVVLARRN